MLTVHTADGLIITNDKNTSDIITITEITNMLTQDSYYRKINNWPLVKIPKILTIKIRKLGDIFSVQSQNRHDRYDNYYNQSDNKKYQIKHEAMIYYIKTAFPYITELLELGNGHLVACGGAIVNAILQPLCSAKSSDIDIFFYDLTPDEAGKMRITAIIFLVEKWKLHPDIEEIFIKRNEFTTTVCIATKEGNFDPIVGNYEEYHRYEFQFIHRIYPTISSIIGGFDLSACMVAYDGNEIYATPLGMWSMQNKSIIIDTKRRSTSFEHRLRKYQRYGFRLIFPGLTQQCVHKYHDDHHAYDVMINKINIIANTYNYEFISKYKEVDDCLIRLKSKDRKVREDILPYFKLTDDSIDINTKIYNKEIIEDRFIDKISDYGNTNSMGKCFSSINAQMLRSNNLKAVCSIIYIIGRTNNTNNNNNDNNSLYDKLLNDIDDPNLMFDDFATQDYIKRVHEIRNFKPQSDMVEARSRDFYRLMKCFGKLTPKVINIRYTDEYYEYRDILLIIMKTNALICQENLKGIKWITQNPGRQWTSSINPIIEDPREWYGKYYLPVLTGIPEEIETTLRLMRLEKTKSIWVNINDDIFSIICLHLLKLYADDAWNHIDHINV
jgi:hypothetical protein